MVFPGTVVKIKWVEKPGGWTANLFLAKPNGFETIELRPGKKLEFELTKERHCTGYAPEKGVREVCPDYIKLEKGDQCPRCRRKDIYSGYVRGEKNSLEGDFSVYLVQINDQLKVGVTRSSKIPERWIEQGADYGAEIVKDLDSNEALDKEDELTSEKISQRVRKEEKNHKPSKPGKLQDLLDKKDFNSEIIDVQDKTVYPNLDADIKRKGLFEGEIKSVKGQIISNGDLGLAMTSGKVLKPPVQKGLTGFQ